MNYHRAPNCRIKRKPVALHLSTKEEFYLLKRYSTLSKLFRVTAYCKRWYERVINKKGNYTDIKVDATDLVAARLTIIKLVQQHYFFEEITLIKSETYIKTTKIALLRWWSLK